MAPSAASGSTSADPTASSEGVAVAVIFGAEAAAASLPTGAATGSTAPRLNYRACRITDRPRHTKPAYRRSVRRPGSWHR
jgi:hypothetical protein